MQKAIFVIAAIFAVASLYAQVPQAMSYQTVIRNTTGDLVQNQVVGIRITILQDNTSVYQETQTPSTNANGLASMAVGMGTPVSGTFTGINWSAGNLYIKTETDPAGGNNYTIVGQSQLLSVPYALHSATADTATIALNAVNISAGSSNYIQNSTSQQDSSNFNISGAGIIGTNLLVEHLAGIAGGLELGAYAGVSTPPPGGMIVSGNVGIGTKNPISALQTTGNLTVGPDTLAGAARNVQLTADGRAPIYNRLSYGTGGDSVGFAIASNALGVTADIMTFQYNGNVGIGTDTPQHSLDVVGDVNASTGYTVNGTATSGNYLRGNGVRFVSSGIQASDVPSLAGNYIVNGTSQQASSNFNISGTGTLPTLYINNSSTVLTQGGSNVALRTTTPYGNVDIGMQNSQFAQYYTSAPASIFNTPLWCSNALSSNNNDLQLQTGGVTQVTIKNGSGNVGIGTTSPISLLADSSLNPLASDGEGDNQGSLNWGLIGASKAGYAGLFYNTGTAAANSGLMVKIAGTTSSNKLLDLSTGPVSGIGTPVMNVQGDGDVGIGTNSPQTILDIAMTGNMLRAGGASGNNMIQVYTNLTNAIGMWAANQNRLYTTGSLTFSVNATAQTLIAPTGYTDAMTILSDGQIGVATATPQSQLDVNGSVSIGSYGGSFAAPANGLIVSGPVCIGTSTPESGYQLTVNGSGYGTAWNSSSDRRYKKNINSLQNALGQIEQLQGVNYDWRRDEFPDKNFNDRKQIGLIAQDVEKVVPEVVSVDDKGYYSVNYPALVPVLIEAMKQQEKKIDSIEAQNNQLKSDNESLKNLTGKLQSAKADAGDVTDLKLQLDALKELIERNGIRGDK